MPGLPVKPRKVAAGALGLTAKGLEIGALVAKLVAQRLGSTDGQSRGGTRGDEGPGPVRVAETRLAPPPAERREAGEVLQAPTEPVPLVDAHARTFETHAEELADKPAADVIRAARDLSTDELRALYEYEQGHKKRKTVLQEIEAQLAPVG